MQFRLHLQSLTCLALVCSLSACPSSDDGDVGEEIGETAGTDETAGSETAGTDETAGGSQGSETGPDSATDDTTGQNTGDTTGDTGTTGDPLNDELCMQACALFLECSIEIPDCLAGCVAHHDALEGECLGFEQALTACVAGLTCDEVSQLLEGAPEPLPCAAEQALTCDSPVCEAGVGIGENPGECSFEYICPDLPIYEVVCDGSSCSCLEDGVEVGGCSDAAGFCAELDDVTVVNACCGWSL